MKLSSISLLLHVLWTNSVPLVATCVLFLSRSDAFLLLSQVHHWKITLWRLFRRPLKISNQPRMLTSRVPVQVLSPIPHLLYQKDFRLQIAYKPINTSATFRAFPVYTFQTTANQWFCRQLPVTVSRARSSLIWNCPVRGQCTWTCAIALTPDLRIQWAEYPQVSSHIHMLICTQHTVFLSLLTHRVKLDKVTHHAQQISRVSATQLPCRQQVWSDWPASIRVLSWLQLWIYMEQRRELQGWTTERREPRKNTQYADIYSLLIW